MKPNPFISVIIPTRDLSRYLIEENLLAFTHQTYKRFEVIVLPNEKSDKDEELLKHYAFLRIIPTHDVTRPAMKRDIGVKHAKGDIIAFIDDDAYPKPDWLQNAVDTFVTHDVAAVCGPGILPPHAEPWEKAFDEVLKTKVGSGGYAYRFFPGKQQYVDDYPSMNFLITKELFTKLGGFNNDYWPGEDSKLCNDLVHKNKEQILYSPKVTIYHHRRNKLKPYLKQHGSYGYHRGAFFAHGDANSRRFVYLVPSFFSLYLLFVIVDVLLAGILKLPYQYLIILLLPLTLYVLNMFVLAFRSLRNTRDLKVMIGAPLALVLTHVYYGITFIKGLIAGYTKHDRIYS